MLKKRLLAFAMSVLTLMAGCAARPAKSAAEYAVPPGGTVTGAAIQKVKDSGGIAVFKGKSEGVSYRWTFVGTDIEKAAAAQLSVRISAADEKIAREAAGGQDVFAFYPACQGSLPGDPSLTVEPGSKWKNGVYSLYVLGEDGTARLIGDIRITNGAAMPIERSDWKGTFFITAKKSASLPAPSSEASSSASAAASQASQAPQPKASQAPQPEAAQSRYATISIHCETALSNWSKLPANKQDHRVVPSDGMILHDTSVKITDGETVYALLVYACEHYGLQMQHRGSSVYNSQYIAAINNLYEFDGGPLSGWMYEVNGTYPDVGCSQYTLKNGDRVQWNYTCDLGRDLGQSRSTLG